MRRAPALTFDASHGLSAGRQRAGATAVRAGCNGGLGSGRAGQTGIPPLHNVEGRGPGGSGPGGRACRLRAEPSRTFQGASQAALKNQSRSDAQKLPSTTGAETTRGPRPRETRVGRPGPDICQGRDFETMFRVQCKRMHPLVNTRTLGTDLSPTPSAKRRRGPIIAAIMATVRATPCGARGGSWTQGAAPPLFQRPATPPGSPRGGAPRPERPRDPAPALG